MNTMFTVACLPAVISYNILCNSRPADALAVDAQDATVLFEGTGSAAGRALQQVANEGAFQRAVYSARRRLQDATVLFEGTGSGTTHRNDWSGWYASGTTASSGDGKRAAFDSLTLKSVTLSDASGKYAAYTLKSAYTGKTMLAIVQGCMGNVRAQGGSSSTPQFGAGYCTIGDLTAHSGLTGQSSLRIGVGDSSNGASSDAADWALFMPLTGNGNGDYSGNSVWCLGGEAATNNGAGSNKVYLKGSRSGRTAMEAVARVTLTPFTGTSSPSAAPTLGPTTGPSAAPTMAPTAAPTLGPTTAGPTMSPASARPTAAPTPKPGSPTSTVVASFELHGGVSAAVYGAALASQLGMPWLTALSQVQYRQNASTSLTVAGTESDYTCSSQLCTARRVRRASLVCFVAVCANEHARARTHGTL